MDSKEQYIVSENMKNYGCSFIKSLGDTIQRADPHNYRKLKNAFPEYWKKYYNDRKLMNNNGAEKPVE